MKRRLLAGAATLALVVSSQAFAQISIEIGPQQRTHIHEYVVREKVAPVTTIREPVRRGYRVPREVELRTVPEDWGPSVHKYRYFYHENRVYFVDPDSREVIYDLE